MAHTIEIDHRKQAPTHPPYELERVPTGRVAAAYEPPGENGRALARALKKAVEGEVRFDNGSRALYATDASNYRQVPIGVVIPKSIEDVIATVNLCREHGAPVVLRGGGTSLAGQGCNVAVLIDFSKYLNRILSVDAGRCIAEVEPGCILDHLRNTAERHHLTFGPDPSTHDHCTLGGMIGNNSCGVHSVMAGRTSDNTEALDIVTYDGLRMTVGRTSDSELRSILADGGRRAEIYRELDAFREKYADLIRARYPKIPRRVSGYENLDQLLPENGFNVARALVGTESTCVTVLRAKLRLVASPQKRVLVLLAFPDIFAAADAVPEILSYGPIGLEAIDDLFVKFVKRKHLHAEYVKRLPDGGGWLFVEFAADTQNQEQAAERLAADFKRDRISTEVVRDPAEQAKLWTVRKDGLPATTKLKDWPETYEGWEDSAVPREKLGDYLRELKALLHRYAYETAVYGHFGDGLVHCRINFDLSSEEGLQNWQDFLNQAADLVVKYGGSISGEHGDGQAKAALLEKMYGPELVEAFREFKAIWDPQWKMNPGKVVDPFPITSNLRIGPQYRPPQIQAQFAYPEDAGSFARATARCVGVGTCRRRDSGDGVMCPSYLATGEEKHSTRGRARMLFEMLHGGPIDNRFRSDAVEEALDLCLACKGCKSDCPVNVDMATYKAEFRARHYARRLRPRAAYSMGRIYDVAKMASRAPWLANMVFSAPGLSSALKLAGGIAPERTMPRFANQTFVNWFRRHKPHANGPRILLWPDTFNNFFRPQTAIAATRVFEALGFTVAIPDVSLCCGRPLYDWGWIEPAKRLWQQTLAALKDDIQAGTPLIGLEPACLSAFRDELPNLFPNDESAQRLSRQSVFFSDFLAEHWPENISKANGHAKALVQLHCHQHAIIKPDGENKLLRRLGADHEILRSGCCGMAGAFGFERSKYEVSQTLAERVLLPAVRSADANTAILANGFSCREQVEQGAGRRTLHIAEFAARCLRIGEHG